MVSFEDLLVISVTSCASLVSAHTKKQVNVRLKIAELSSSIALNLLIHVCTVK